MDRIALPQADQLPSDAVLEERAEQPDRRRHRRMRPDLPARIMLPGGREVDGVVASISAGGMEVAVRIIAPVGQTIVAYVERLGRLEGRVVRPTREGFIVEFSKRAARAKRLADSLTWVANMEPHRDRRGSRRFHKDVPASLVRSNGEIIECRILDISTSGASVGIVEAEIPAIGEAVTVGVMSARVVRHHETGIGVKFELNAADQRSATKPGATARDEGVGSAEDIKG